MLKRIAFVAAVLVALEGISFAFIGTTATLIDDATMVTAGLSFKPSNKVGIVYVGDANGQNYTITAKHASGDSYYATSNMANNIYKKIDSTKVGTAITAVAHDNSFAAGETVFTGYVQI